MLNGSLNVYCESGRNEMSDLPPNGDGSESKDDTAIAQAADSSSLSMKVKTIPLVLIQDKYVYVCPRPVLFFFWKEIEVTPLFH